jgi:hypothetical protein
MHGYLTEHEFLTNAARPLGGYFAVVAVLNALAGYWLIRSARAPTSGRSRRRAAVLWFLVAGLFAGLSAVAFAGRTDLLALPQELRSTVNQLLGPMSICTGSLVTVLVMFWLRGFFVRPSVAWTLLNLALLFMGLSLTDQDFAKIVTKPDNIAIVSLMFLLGYFTWLSAYKAVQNDRRLARGEEPLEKLDSDTVLVWPDLVYIELICMVILTAVLIFWAVGVTAPLEEPASAVRTPNPSKAPWYFVGLQEMLYYFDPWMAGVVLPGLIIFGLMAIPYLDRNPRGNGYYTIQERRFAYFTFQFGFLLLWIMLILMGTFMRGPNWSFFGLYEPWDVHKVTAQNNVTLSQYFWIDCLGIGLPQPAAEARGAARLAMILLRESPGLLLLLAYFFLVPAALAKATSLFRDLRQSLGRNRYLVMTTLLLIMLLLPIKMVARWTGNLQYIVAIPEYFLNL